MIKLLIALLIIACIAPLFIKGPDGEPMMTLDDWKIELPASLDELLKRSEPELPGGELPAAQKVPTTVYKWQDDDGQWHFANTPPDMETAESMELDGNINIMDAYQPLPAAGEVAQAEPDAPVPSGMTTVSPDKIKEMMETVTNLQETVDQRKADMDSIAGFED